MITTRQLLISALNDYKSAYKIELDFCAQFLTLLKSRECYLRSHLPGHITGSAWIIDESRTFTLLTHHAKLNKWLQPGGHADGDENILNVALREANEETGLTNLVLAGNGIFDIDVHHIPARVDFPAHVHYDIRFVVQASMTDKIICSEESHNLAWKKISEIPQLTEQNPSMIRMAEKTKLLRTH
jgi:8-oxo-dGTP pyrophosphatase MutT (NUDIX family)